MPRIMMEAPGAGWVNNFHKLFSHNKSGGLWLSATVNCNRSAVSCIGGGWKDTSLYKVGLSKIMTYIEYVLITSKEYNYNMPPVVFSAT